MMFVKTFFLKQIHLNSDMYTHMLSSCKKNLSLFYVYGYMPDDILESLHLNFYR